MFALVHNNILYELCEEEKWFKFQLCTNHQAIQMKHFVWPNVFTVVVFRRQLNRLYVYDT